MNSTDFHINTMHSIFCPAEWSKNGINGRKLSACSFNAFSSIAQSLWTTLCLCSYCFHRSCSHWSTIANCTTIFTEYIHVFINLLPGAFLKVKSLMNSFTAYVCEMHIILLSTMRRVQVIRLRRDRVSSLLQVLIYQTTSRLCSLLSFNCCLLTAEIITM